LDGDLVVDIEIVTTTFDLLGLVLVDLLLQIHRSFSSIPATNGVCRYRWVRVYLADGVEGTLLGERELDHQGHEAQSTTRRVLDRVIAHLNQCTLDDETRIDGIIGNDEAA